MSTQLTPELRAKMISAIRENGLSTADAAKRYKLTEKTVRKWVRGAKTNAVADLTELQRLRDENVRLQRILAELLLAKELAKQNIRRL